MMLEYLVNSPYGRKHECSAFEDMISHFKHRQELELSLIHIYGHQVLDKLEQDTPQTVECSKDDKQAQPLTDKAA